MLNTKLGFFYVHRFARLIYEVTKSIYETYGCLFPNIYCSSDASMCWFGDLTGNRQPFVYISVNLPVYSQTNTCFMKTIGALCVTFLFPPAVAAAAYCVYRAKREGGER